MIISMRNTIVGGGIFQLEHSDFRVHYGTVLFSLLQSVLGGTGGSSLFVALGSLFGGMRHHIVERPRQCRRRLLVDPNLFSASKKGVPAASVDATSLSPHHRVASNRLDAILQARGRKAPRTWF